MPSGSFDLKPHRVENLTAHTFEVGSQLIDVRVAWGMVGEELRLSVKALEYVLGKFSWECRRPLYAGADNPHWGLILEADLSYPIIVIQEPEEDRLTIVDGRHRIVKSWLLGNEFITAKLLDQEALVKEASISSADDCLVSMPGLKNGDH